MRPPATSMAFSDFVRLLREKGIKETFYLEYLALHQYLGAAVAVRAIVLAVWWVIAGRTFAGFGDVFGGGNAGWVVLSLTALVPTLAWFSWSLLACSLFD